MKVTVLAEPWEIPPRYYGGAERMCHLLCDGLVSQGHQVNLLSAKASVGYNGKTLGHKLPSSNLCDRALKRVSFAAKSLRLAWQADVIYTYRFWPEYFTVVNHLKIPLIYCQQNTSKADDLQRVLRCNPNYGFMQGVSNDQILSLKEAPSNERLFMIYNAVNTNVVSPVARPASSYLAYLGRLNYDKGVDLAVEISRRTGVPLKIAGVIRPHEPEARILFEEKVRPFLGDQIEFIGPIDDSQKSDFLGNALALLMPNRWREPFGITMAESLASGTPVIGTSVGSIPEVIDDMKTGFVCHSFEQMCDSVRQVHLIRRKDCRDSALSRFSHGVYLRAVIDMFNDCRGYVS